MRALVVLGVIALVAGAIVFKARSSVPSPVAHGASGPALVPGSGNGGTKSGPTTPAIISPVSPVKRVIECEDYETLDAKSGDGKEILKVVTQSEGRTISFLQMPEDWIKQCGYETTLKGKPDQLPGRATYRFEVPRDDTYYVNLRARWADECGDSVFVKLDGGGWFVLEDSNGKLGEKNYRWAWHQLMVGGKPKGFELKAGEHILHLGTREDGPCLDQWVLTTEASVPVGEAAKASVGK